MLKREKAIEKLNEVIETLEGWRLLLEPRPFGNAVKYEVEQLKEVIEFLES